MPSTFCPISIRCETVAGGPAPTSACLRWNSMPFIAEKRRKQKEADQETKTEVNIDDMSEEERKKYVYVVPILLDSMRIILCIMFCGIYVC